MRILLSGILFTLYFQLFAQYDFSEIDEKSKLVSPYLRTYSEIAEQLTKDLKSDVEKARAIYIWITHNISYDMNFDMASNLPLDKEIISYVLTNRRGICQHFSVLFNAMGKSVGLKTYFIEGTSKDKYSGALGRHAWNAIEIDDSIYMIDATWSAGYVKNNKYYHDFNDAFFFILPEVMIIDHFPANSKHQYLENPISVDEFISQGNS